MNQVKQYPLKSSGIEMTIEWTERDFVVASSWMELVNVFVSDFKVKTHGLG